MQLPCLSSPGSWHTQWHSPPLGIFPGSSQASALSPGHVGPVSLPAPPGLSQSLLGSRLLEAAKLGFDVPGMQGGQPSREERRGQREGDPLGAAKEREDRAGRAQPAVPAPSGQAEGPSCTGGLPVPPTLSLLGPPGRCSLEHHRRAVMIPWPSPVCLKEPCPVMFPLGLFIKISLSGDTYTIANRNKGAEKWVLPTGAWADSTIWANGCTFEGGRSP